MTELQVLQSRFVDPDYQPGELDSLIASVDIHVRSQGCVNSAGERVGVRVSHSGGGFVKSRVLAAADSQYVFTVPVRGAPAEYVVRGQCLTCLTFPNVLFFQKDEFIVEPLVLSTVRDANGLAITMEVLARFFRGA